MNAVVFIINDNHSEFVGSEYEGTPEEVVFNEDLDKSVFTDFDKAWLYLQRYVAEKMGEVVYREHGKIMAREKSCDYTGEHTFTVETRKLI